MASDENGTLFGISPSDTEMELRRLREAHALLLDELRNRVRNVLSTIRSVMRRSADLCETPDDLAAHLDGRLGALTRAHSLLLNDLSVAQDLAMLVSGELFAYRVQEGGQLFLEGPVIGVRPWAVSTLVLAFHELATNALKYGALSRTQGQVAVTWCVTADGSEGLAQLAIEWRETAGPRLTGRPARRGFGTELLEQSLPYELHARVDLTYAPDGLRCLIRLPQTAWVMGQASKVEWDEA